jgi:hypothetical protein
MPSISRVTPVPVDGHGQTRKPSVLASGTASDRSRTALSSLPQTLVTAATPRITRKVQITMSATTRLIYVLITGSRTTSTATDVRSYWSSDAIRPFSVAPSGIEEIAAPAIVAGTFAPSAVSVVTPRSMNVTIPGRCVEDASATPVDRPGPFKTTGTSEGGSPSTSGPARLRTTIVSWGPRAAEIRETTLSSSRSAVVCWAATVRVDASAAEAATRARSPVSTTASTAPLLDARVADDMARV